MGTLLRVMGLFFLTPCFCPEASATCGLKVNLMICYLPPHLKTKNGMGGRERINLGNQ